MYIHCGDLIPTEQQAAFYRILMQLFIQKLSKIKCYVGIHMKKKFLGGNPISTMNELRTYGSIWKSPTGDTIC